MPPLRWRFSLSLALLFPYHFPYRFPVFSAQHFPAEGRNPWQFCEVKRFLRSVHVPCARVTCAHEIRLTFFHVCLWVIQKYKYRKEELLLWSTSSHSLRIRFFRILEKLCKSASRWKLFHNTFLMPCKWQLQWRTLSRFIFWLNQKKPFMNIRRV